MDTFMKFPKEFTRKYGGSGQNDVFRTEIFLNVCLVTPENIRGRRAD